MKRRTRRLLSYIALAVLIPTVGFGSDFAARYWLLVNEPPTASQFRVGRPAAYRDSPYFSAAFADEQGRFSQAWYVDDAGFWENDFRGKWYNHSGKERLTVGQPANAANTLYLFGSSTTLNAEVPDAYTIASYLQKDIGASYRVVNMGILGMSAQSQYLLLHTLPLHKGDMVVFYDGITDASAGFKPVSQARGALLTGQLCNWLSSKVNGLGIVQMYCALTDRALPDNQRPDVGLVRDDFATNLSRAYELCKSKGVTFYHFLQPVIWSRSPSRYEQQILSNRNLVPTGQTGYVALTWPSLQDASRQYPGADLTHSLDALRASGADIYLDYDHTNERGNEAVARAMVGAMWLQF